MLIVRIDEEFIATELQIDSKPTANKGFAKAGIPCFTDTFVQGGHSVLRLHSGQVFCMNFSANTPRHRKPPKRWHQLEDDCNYYINEIRDKWVT